MSRRGRHLLLIVTITLAASANAAAQGSKSVSECGPAKTRVEAVAAEQTATPERALTVRLEPTSRLRDAFGRDGAQGDRPLRLCVQVAKPPQGIWKGLRVFLNSPDVDARTPLSTPHYVGSIAFYGGNEGDTQSFMLNLGRTVRRLKQAGVWPARGPLNVTLVPIPSAKSASGATGGISVTKVTIAVPE